jgi:hypothetical protein
METRATRRRAEIAYAGDYRGWVRPAWIRSCVLASVAAMTLAAVISVVVSAYLAQYRSGTYKVVAVELVAMASVVEGALIGYFQWRVLRRLFPTMSSSYWVSATMIAAGAGCLLSWLPTSFALTTALASRIGDVTPEPAVIARVSLVTGALVGLVWGVAQHAVLRLHAHRTGSWILASITSWAISFVCLYVAAFLPDRATNPLIHIALGALAGLVLGLTLGLLQGRVLAGLHSRLLVTSHAEGVEESAGRERRLQNHSR